MPLRPPSLLLTPPSLQSLEWDMPLLPPSLLLTPPLLQSIEWDMLLFFCGMFIMVEGAVELGLMRKIAAFITFIIDTAPVSAQKV